MKRFAPGLASLAAVAVVTGGIDLLKGHIPVLSLAVLYLLAIIPIAAAWGTVYAVGVALLGMLAFNFFFLPPLYTLTIQDSRNWFALLVFVVTAIVVSELAARSRRRADEAEAALRALRELTAERERLAQEALEAEALRRSDALKTALLRTVSHDLRSPLMAILTSAGALAHGELSLGPEDRQDLAETILGEADRLDRLVANLLDLSRLQAGAAPPEQRDWAIEDVVLEALDGLEAGGRVEVVLPDESPLVHVDPHQIERAVANLVENALRYSPADEPVRVQVREIGRDVLVRVIDHGPGIGSADAARIFEPFQRGGDEDGARGAGLGLAIARGFAEANGGRVWVESHAGQGATFTLALPALPAQVAVEA
ncbi:MAG TPA: ATP-binding protein [Gaiellaceae bacterium]|nr:ATP-binding protein [Gaiellaceae bacterium]HUJ56502.1 ATP-binding protein [Gaiellaceae bacterium]